MDLDEIFKRACIHAKTLKNLSEEQMLKLYGLYKQSLNGSCKMQKPYFWDFTAKAKWESWKAVSDLSESLAKKNYIDLVKQLDVSWDESKNEVESSESKSGGMGIAVSTLAEEQEESIPDDSKTIFDWCKEGNLNQIRALIKVDSNIVHSVDENQMSLLHWSADRGHLQICEYLIECNCNIDTLDGDNQTALHYAVTCDHEQIAELLVKKGASTSIKDTDGLIPFELTSNQNIKKILTM